MIRATIALFVFAVFICAMIVIRPFDDSDTVARDPLGTPVEDVEVTRAATDPLLAAAGTDTDVVQAPTPRAAPVLTIATDNSDMQDTTASVLAELGLIDAPVLGDDQMLDMTAGALANITAITGEAAPAVGGRDTLQSLVAAALREGQSDAYIDALVNEAAGDGRITVPQALVTSDGKVDTAVLLSSIVTQASIAAGGAEPTTPAIDPNQTAGVEVRVIQRADQTIQARFYTVQPGDSLGSIAIKFFGNVNRYPAIYEANRGTLSSPDRIRAGQRLVIPQA